MHPPARPLAALAALAVALAGCVSLPSTVDPAGDAAGAFGAEVTATRAAAAAEDLSAAIDPDHGGAAYLHAVPALHTGSYGLELVGYNPLTRPGEGDHPLGQDSGYGAMDVWNDEYACVTHFAGSTGAAGGATIVDIRDPANPTVVASVLSGMVNSDCQFTDDGRYLLLASYTGVHPGIPAPTGPPVSDAGAQGVLVYDVEDKASPKLLFHDAQGAGGSGYHNFFTATINGTVWIWQTYTGNVLKMKDDASGLELVTQIEHSDHDLWVGRHAVTGGWMLVTGAGYGTAVYDVNDPANPVLLGVWEGDEENRLAGWHRQWPLENTVNGRAILVVAGEECGNGDSLPYVVLDWTDPTNLVTLGSWWIPGQPANEAPPHLCEMNSHEFETWNGYVATGNYHAGVWLFDVGSLERLAEPATIGYYLPHEVPQQHGGAVNAPFVWSPDVWGAYFDSRGYVYAADWHSGLYVLKFEGTPA